MFLPGLISEASNKLMAITGININGIQIIKKTQYSFSTTEMKLFTDLPFFQKLQ